MSSNPFIERYKNYSVVQLLEIVQNKSDYQPLAVETAEAELASRQLTDKEIADANANIEIKKQNNLKQEEKKKAIEDNIKSVGTSILDNLNPIQTVEPTSVKLIKIICLLMIGLFLYTLITNFNMLMLMLQSLDNFDSSSFFYFLPFVIIPLATILFWQRKKAGWTLLSMHLTFTLFTVLCSFIVEFTREPFNVPALENLFPHPSPTAYIWQIIFYGGILLAICKKSIREIFIVDKKYMITVISIIAALTTIQWSDLLIKNNPFF